MRYVLIDNAVVQCDKITNHIILDTSSLFEEKEYRLFCEYEPIFNAIKGFLISDGDTCELFVSSHFYFVPYFVIELQTYVGEDVRIVPIYKLLGSTKTIEHYDQHVIKTVFDNGSYRCTTSNKKDTIEKARHVVEKVVNKSNYKGLGISSIIELNNRIEGLERPNEPLLPIKDFNELVVGDDSYINIVTGEEGFLNFSPFGSLRYYDELTPRVYGFDSINTASMDEMSKAKYSYVITTLSGDISFNNRYQTWINTEKGGTFPIECQQYSKEKRIALMIPDSLIERNEIQIDDMYFGKFFVDMQSDYLGNLHLKIESLDGQSFFQTLQFAL